MGYSPPNVAATEELGDETERANGSPLASRPPSGAPGPGSASFADELGWLRDLRLDERERVERHFRIVELGTSERLELPADAPPRMGFVIAGSVTLSRADIPGLPPVEIRVGAGDHWGELAVFAEIPSAMTITAREPATLALLDPAGFRAIAEEFPIVWVRVSALLSRELKWKNDLLREIQEFDVSTATAAELEVFLESKRRRVARRRTGIARSATRMVYRRLIAGPQRDPAFWILLGFVAAIAASRAVVAFILEFDLQHRLFNLQDSGGANPTHTHHFNYGFAILITAGLLGLLPQSRRFLRALSFVFGIGLGLVFDEFALIWNLNPDYYHSLNYQAIAVLGAVLVQVVYFRKFYAGLLDRLRAPARRPKK